MNEGIHVENNQSPKRMTVIARGLVKECISIFAHSQCKLFHLNFLNTILCSDFILISLPIRKPERRLERRIATLGKAFIGRWSRVEKKLRGNWKEWKDMIDSEK